MRAAWQGLLAHLRRLALVEEATAAVEFALILPIMLLVYIGSVEASVAITTDRKVQSVAGALGDLVARSDTTISTATLEDYFQAAEGIMTPYPTEDLLQTVTQVQVLSNGTASVVWSWQYENGIMGPGAHEAGSAFSLPAPMTQIAQDNSKTTYVIVSEGSYAHMPLFGFIFNQPINLYRENFLMPRFGGNITVN